MTVLMLTLSQLVSLFYTFWGQIINNQERIIKQIYDYSNNNNNNNNNNTDNNNNGNFICVFECTIVNLATYRQFTNAA